MGTAPSRGKKGWGTMFERGIRTVVIGSMLLLSAAGCAKVKVNAGPSTSTSSATTPATTTTTATGGPGGSGSAPSTTEPTAGGLEVTTTTGAGATTTVPVGVDSGVVATLTTAAATGDPCAVHSAVIDLSPTAGAAALTAAAQALSVVREAVDPSIRTDWAIVTTDFTARSAQSSDLASQRAGAVSPDAETAELAVAKWMDQHCPK